MAEDIRPEVAIRAAKTWLAQIYADEAIASIALEEVRFRDGNWEIALGFNRVDQNAPSSHQIKALEDLYNRRQRVYKVSGTGNRIMEMRSREIA